MAQDEPLPAARLLYAAPGMVIALFGMLFCAGAGTYVGWHSPGDITLLVMQAFIVYSAPFILLAAAGLIAYQINRLKVLAVLYALSTAILTGTAIAIIVLSVRGEENPVKQLDNANTTAFITGLVMAVILSALLLFAAKRIRPRKRNKKPPRNDLDDFLPF